MTRVAGPTLPPPLGSPFQRRFQAWVASRQPRADTLLLTQRNVYILPTRAGWMFALTVLILILASINYQLNLGYVLSFLLAGSGAVSIHMTHATLRGLTLHLKPIAPTFAGDPVGLDVVLTSPGAARHGIGLKVAGADADTLTWIDVPALGQSQARVSLVATTRGLHTSPTLSAETRFPFGLFRTWTIWRPAAEYLVYPRPEPAAPPLPRPEASVGGPAPAVRRDGAEIDGVRAYRRGDSLRMIAWKKTAKAMAAGGELVSRDTRAASQPQLWLDWQTCGGRDPEARLQRLCAWVLAARRAGADYGLRLPGTEVPPADGDLQHMRCLEALALWT